jgi:hypothetical protein
MAPAVCHTTARKEKYSWCCADKEAHSGLSISVYLRVVFSSAGGDGASWQKISVVTGTNSGCGWTFIGGTP